MSKKKKKAADRAADPRLAAPYPTANSPEFVPLTGENAAGPASADSRDTYDFIPELKDERRFR